MRKKLLFLLFFLISPFIIYNFYGPAAANKNTPTNENLFVPSTSGGLDKFYVGAISDDADYHCQGCTDPFDQLDQLGFNMWHQYVTWDNGPVTGFRYPGSPFAFAGDNLFATVDDYDEFINPRIAGAYDSPSNRRLLMTRPKIEYLCYGQRSDYQCEAVSPGEDLWFYAFNESDPFKDINDNSIFGQGAKVKYMQVNTHQTDGGADWVVQKLRANTEQCKPGPYWQGDAQSEWLIKPKIRINKDFANEPANENVHVCQVVVRNQSGNVFKSVDLIVKNFLVDPGNTYDGRYIEEYRFNTGDTTLRITAQAWGSWFKNGARGMGTCETNYNLADIQVYWYGNCDMWIDYVRVDNDIAHRLLKTGGDQEYETWLEDEVKMIGLKPINNTPYILKYYMELFEFNNIPCMAYVNKKLQLHSLGTIDLIADLTPDNISFHVPECNIPDIWNAGFLEKYYVNVVKPSCLYSQSYPLNACYTTGQASDDQPFSKIPVTLPDHDGLTDSILAQDVSVTEYEDWLQDNLNHSPSVWEGGTDNTCGDIGQWRGDFRSALQMCNELSERTGKPFVFMPQAHQWWNRWETHREPTYEEIDMMTNVAVSYGAKSINYFSYPSGSYIGTPMRDYQYVSGDYGIGLADVSQPPPDKKYRLRYTNVYDQEQGNCSNRYKWEVFRDITDRLINKWGPTLMTFDNTATKSYIYNDEMYDMAANTYIAGVYTYHPGSGEVPCSEDFPEGDTPPVNTIGECKYQRYVQVSTFKNPDEPSASKYFMIVNRRCAPNRPEISENGGKRFIKLQFSNHNNDFGNHNGWNIYEAQNLRVPVGGFTLSSGGYAELGWFKPGEGRLYKIMPVTKTGGILAGDEEITGESFTCEDTIFSNGYNITIGAGTNMKFTDSSCIVMNGGVFTMGDQQVSGSQNITFDAASGSSWRGHSFTGTEIHIYGASFTGLANDSVYALNMINCPVVDIRNTAFNTVGTLKGGINAVYYADPMGGTPNINFYAGGNTFTATGSTIPTVIVSSFAGVTTPLIIENNTFTNGNTAIFLSGITGGAVKSNVITDNYTGISLLSSYIDVSGNTIASTVNGSTGIFAAGGSEIKMNPAGPKKFGGMNSISNEGTGTNNIKVESSYFLTDGGQNVFNISDISTSYHLYGYFPLFTAIPYDETVNCFKISGSPTNTPYNLVTDGYQGSQITFNFYPLLSGCDPEQGDNMMVLDLGDGINDTIYSNGSGSGGGDFKQTTPSAPSTRDGHPSLVRRGAFTPPNVNTAYDSICMLMRSRNYSAARTKCLEMIGNYPDSMQSLNALAKLYLASVSSNANITDLKVFYENLILNHPNNTSLVKRANYYILKCKVRLHEYTSALAGFQQIINENPYSYEGLIARWDYMATSLLVPGSGGESSDLLPALKLRQSGGFSIADLKAEDLEAEDREGNPKSEFRDPNFWDDKSPFTKEQRIDIRKSINTAIENDKNENDRKIRVLETKSDQGDINAIKELAQVKALKQVVKTEKPRSITEHIKLVSEDIQKVFGNVTGGKGKDMSNIPTVYRLSQNYPNPFNPVTKINYDLPKDAKVNIVVYDILGREVKRLVNNELKTAGTYIIDFNASNYASGVYFYRIEAEEPGGNKFVDSKKMVLIK